MAKARKYVLAKQFDGFPKREDVKIVEEELPPLKDGGKSVRTVIFQFISFQDRAKVKNQVYFSLQPNISLSNLKFVVHLRIC